MKKLCARCGAVNEYEATSCSGCGAPLDECESYKQCPSCGKIYSLRQDECPECRETLVVRGSAAAMVFDETQTAEGLSAGIWLLSVLLPVFGFFFGLICAAGKRKTGALSSEQFHHFLLVTAACQLVICTALVLLVSILIGNLVQN